MMSVRYQYLRNQSGQPVGCVAIKLDNEGLLYQLSVLNPLDRFSRDRARSIALDRLEKRVGWVVANSSKEFDNMHKITVAVMTHIKNNKSVASRARKAAKYWLSNHTQEKVEQAVQLDQGVYT